MSAIVKSRIPNLEPLILPAHAWSPEGAAGARSLWGERGLKSLLNLHIQIMGGSAPLQGYNTEGDVLRTTINGVDLNALWNEYQRVLALYNAQRQPIVDLLTYTVPRNIERVPQVGSQGAFERASEYGVPKSMRAGVTYFNVGFGFDWFDTGSRYTWRFLAEADDAQVNAVNAAILEADNRLVFQTVMWTLFNNVNRLAEIDGEQNINIYAFYNNDGTVPPTYGPNTFLGTHQHYLFSGAGVVDSGDLDEIQTHLNHHGYSVANGYDLVLLVNEQELTTIRGFKSVQNGGTSKYDFIPAQGTANFLLPVNFIVNGGNNGQPANTYRGMQVAGRWGDLLILVNDYFPAGYLVGFATGGPENVTNPIGIREHARAEYRGLRLIKGRSPDYPLQESYYLRGFGTGIRHRGAGVVMRIHASAYTPPTAYATRP